MQADGQPSASPLQAGASAAPDPVETALQALVIVRPTWLRMAAAYGALGLGLMLLADLVLLNGRLFVFDPLRATGIVTAMITMFLLQMLFNRTPRVLRSLWERGLIGAPRSAQTFDQFIVDFDRLLDSRRAWFAAAAFCLVALLNTYKVLFWFRYCAAPASYQAYLTDCSRGFTPLALAQYYLWGNLAIITPLVALVVGLLSWRFLVIAWSANRLSQRFTLKVQFRHPDASGGFGPFGDLCLLSASMLIVPALYFALWGVAIESPLVQHALGLPPVNVYSLLWSGMYRYMLVVLLNAVAIWVFIGPVYRVHQQMQQRRDELQQQVDELSGKVAGQTAIALPESDLALLREGVTSAFNEDELRTLCFDLGVEYEDLDAIARDGKARELVATMHRAGRLGELVSACRKQRPNTPWPSLPAGGSLLPEDLAHTYHDVETAPVWPLGRSTLFIAFLAQTSLIAALVASGVIRG